MTYAEVKECRECRQTKPLDVFYGTANPSAQRRRFPLCLDCHGAAIKKGHLEGSKRSREYVDRYAAKYAAKYAAEQDARRAFSDEITRLALEAPALTKKRRVRRELPPEKMKQVRAQREAARAKQYGVSVLELRLLLDTQGGCCAVCGSKANLRVDHCHTTNKVRGFLCNFCNTTEGMILKVGLSPSDFGHRLQEYLNNPPFESMKR